MLRVAAINPWEAGKLNGRSAIVGRPFLYMYDELLTQAAGFAEDVVGENTHVTGVGIVRGVVNQFGAERALKRGAIGSGVEGTVTIVYRRSLFTAAQLNQVKSGSIKVPSLSSHALAVTGMELDPTWVTFTVQVR